MSLCKLWAIVKDREAWHIKVHGVAKSQTQLSDWMTTKTKYLTFQFTEPSVYLFLVFCYKIWSDQWPKDIVFISLSKCSDLYEFFQNKYQVMLWRTKVMNFVAKEKVKKKHTKSTLYSEIGCKSNYHQETFTSHKVNEKYHSHKRKREQAIGKTPLSGGLEDTMWEKLAMHMLADISLQSWTKPVICGVWINTTGERNTQNLIYFSFNIH